MDEKLTATFTQEGGSHVSYEDKPTTAVIPVMLLAFTVAAAVIGNLVMKRRREGGRVHPTLWCMLAALSMHWLFLGVHTLHLCMFAGGSLSTLVRSDFGLVGLASVRCTVEGRC